MINFVRCLFGRHEWGRWNHVIYHPGGKTYDIRRCLHCDESGVRDVQRISLADATAIIMEKQA